ncbi:Aldehyde dehydrogenase [Alloactinosynnema sp. L-07]|uniref:aldehyde dehydrogenase family protein n=1 Tax=Alloactinosynnema sp. L-07 TaxID=1653480 RepID=UPI00065EFEDB|nr:aldehyde dehydrogenase family protein [Alloactinosynnema sp. L-07]CRK60449.1 Aldehyde dehydrogenase [Alloactinosynnema sp. L-07]
MTTVQATFESVNPATGEVVGTHPIATAAEVQAAVDRARPAAAWWASLGFSGRAERLNSWKAVLTRRAHELADVVRAETGKPHGDAMLEIILAIDHTAWAAKNARKVLGAQRRSPGLLMINHAASVEYQPLGVVGVIGPWNYPVFTPMGSIAYALAAGNAVVFKPSEYTPAVGRWLADSFAEVVAEQPVFQVVTGLGATGAALCRSGVAKIAFTGSPGTGKKIMAACADTLTPVLIEAGGKDALLVDADADVDAAADAAVWGGFSNAGQTCVGVERVYVHEQVYDEFVAKVVAKARAVKPGTEIGPITMPAQLDIIRRHISDAVARGGRALVGGGVGERFVEPTVLVDVPEDADAVREETFGPTLTVAKVRDMDEAIAKANDTAYGLGGTVFSKARGMELARRLRSGMVAVNSVISFAGVPSLPFGGSGDSGFGRIHGPEGLREFGRPKAIARMRFRAPLTLTTFARTAKVDERVAKLIKLLHGR